MMRLLFLGFIAAIAFAATEPVAVETRLEQQRLRLLASVWNSADAPHALARIKVLRAAAPGNLLGKKNMRTRWAYWKLNDSLTAGERALTTGMCEKALPPQSFESCLRKAMLGELN